MKKYNLRDMGVGDQKKFPLADYSKIRLACHFTGKRYGRKYRTEKKEKIVVVYREH